MGDEKERLGSGWRRGRWGVEGSRLSDEKLLVMGRWMRREVEMEMEKKGRGVDIEAMGNGEMNAEEYDSMKRE